MALNQRRIVRITRELIGRFYEKKENVCGGVLHIVTDDHNIRDGDIEFCIERAKEKRDGDALRIANNMMLMTIEERKDCLGITRGS